MNTARLPKAVAAFGLAGIIPQLICLGVAMAWHAGRWFALAAGCCYAAVILSFLGGLWWMAALFDARRHPGAYFVAVLPSLVAWGAMLPWCFGWRWPGPSLLLLGFCLLASPWVDRSQPWADRLPAGWLRLRVMMASGLALSTLALALFAPLS